MTFAEELAARWEAELEGVRQSILHWRSGKMRMLENDQDVTEQYVRQLESIAKNLEEGINMLLRGG